jgi:TP901 family phage tail tape measure protein
MADLTLTGDSRSAVRAIAEIRLAISRATAGSLTMAKAMRDATADIRRMSRSGAVLNTLGASADRLAEKIRKSTAEYKLQAKEIANTARSIRTTLNRSSAKVSFLPDAGQKGQITTLIDNVRVKMDELGLKAAPVKRLFSELFAGQTPTKMTDEMRKIEPLLSRIVNLQTGYINKQKQSIEVGKKLVQTTKDRLDAEAKASLGERRGRIFAEASSPNQSKIFAARATDTEVGKLNRANLAIAEANRKAQLSTRQLTQLQNDYVSGVKRSFSAAEAIMLPHIERRINAIRRLGNEHVKAEAKAAAAAAAAARKIATSYEAANNHLNNLVLSWRSIIRLASIQTLHLAFGRLVSTAFEASRALAQLQTQIALIQSISQDAQLSQEQWSDSILALSSNKGFDAVEVAAATYEAISNQVTRGAEAVTFMGQALDFARATGSSTTDAVNLLSSAINSFGKSSADAEQLASELFAVIDLGRVKAEDLANTYGRVAPAAKQLGLSTAEFGASIAVLTRIGVKPREVLTQISGIVTKLIAPTEEMTELFGEWGVASGEAAVRTFGFLGVLQKLQIAAESGDSRLTELAQLFNEVRGLRGAAFLSSDQGIKEFSDTLSQITGRIENYKEAVRVTSESNAAVLKKSTEEFKNYVLKNIVEPIQNFIVGMIRNGTTLTSLFVSLRAAILPLLTSYAAWRIAIILANGGLARAIQLVRTRTQLALLETQVLSKNIVVQKKAEQALADYARAGAVFKSLGIGVAISVITAAWVTYAQVQAEIAESERARAEVIKRLTAVENQQAIRQQQILEKLSGAFRKALDARYQALRQYAAAVSRLAGTIESNLAEALEDAIDRSKDSMKDFVSDLDKSITDIGSRIKELNSEIDKATKNRAKSGETFQKRIFDQLLKNVEKEDDPAKTIKLIEERKKQLEAAAKLAQANIVQPNGTINEDAHEVVVKNLEEAANLQERIADIMRETGDDTGLRKLLSPAGEFARIQKLLNQYQDDYIAKLKRAEQLEQAKLDRQKQAVEAVKEQFKVLEKINSKTPETSEDRRQQINATMDQVGTILRTLVGAGIDLNTATKLFSTFEDQLRTQGQALVTARQSEKLSGTQKDIDALEADKQAEAKKLLDIQSNTVAESKKAFGEISSFADAFSVSSLLNVSVSAAKEAFGRAEAKGLPKRFFEGGDVDVDQLLQNLRTATATAAIEPSAGNLSAVDASLKNFAILVDSFTEASPQNADFVTMMQQVSTLQNQLNKVFAGTAAAKTAETALQNITTNLAAQQQSFTAQIATLDKLSQAEIKHAQDRQRMIQALDQANNYLRSIAGLPKKAAGGWISGGIPGRDSVPILAQQGEFVVNARAAQRNAALLTALNSGRGFRGYAQGGFVSPKGGSSSSSVSFDFSGMAISVQGGSSDRETAMNIGRILEREVRRGTIKLN